MAQKIATDDVNCPRCGVETFEAAGEPRRWKCENGHGMPRNGEISQKLDAQLEEGEGGLPEDVALALGESDVLTRSLIVRVLSRVVDERVPEGDEISRVQASNNTGLRRHALHGHPRAHRTHVLETLVELDLLDENDDGFRTTYRGREVLAQLDD